MKTKKSFLWLAFLILATIWILVRHNQQVGYYSVKGLVFGTVYKITYQHDGDLKPEIEAELKRFDQSLSPFNDSSVISRVNRNEELVTDSFFQKCFNRSMEISHETKGAFDITVAPLANAWGFGFKKGAFPDSLMIDSLLQITGYEKVKMDNGKVIKQDPRTMLSCSAVAKGYSVDVIAQLLDRKGIKNYMVDIGGEVVVKGKNPSKGLWRIGINKPVDDSLAVNQDLQTILEITDLGLATSGNYRNYYYKDGKKYAHTIDPRTGYPVQHNILSSTVIAKDCMTADALATAFMVMGLEEAEAFCKADTTIDAYFIYRIREYAEKYGCKYVEGAKPWGEKCDIALPSATQNELNGDHARQLVANGCIAVSEGANMPSTPEAIKVFQDAKILYAPGKAANAGGVSVSGLEMTQNSIKLSWSAEEVDEKLKSIMKNIHEACVQYGTEADGYVNYVKGANGRA